jgi:putative transcriptional regulator
VGNVAVVNTLKEIRHDLRMNQTEFADFLGINVNQYNKYENNKKQPNLENALAIFEKIKTQLKEKRFEEIFIRVSE